VTNSVKNRNPLFFPIVNYLIKEMLSGLKEGQEKMSKSDPDSAIFMEDSEQEVKTKIKKAFCPIGVAEGNPILDYVKNIVFGSRNKFTIYRKKENGGD
jgi:tyrosyl-tRNA synthetase